MRIINRYNSIKHKVVTLVLLISMTGIMAVSAVTLLAMNSMRNSTVNANMMLGNQVATDSKIALADQAKRSISELARSKSDYIEQRFEITENYVDQIADEMTRIYETPDSYSDHTVNEPKLENQGTITTQLLFSKRVSDRQAVLGELGKIGNIDSLLHQVVKQDSIVAAAYIATETGIVLMSDKTPQKKYSEDGSKILPYEADKRPWYIKAKAENKLIFTDVIYDVHGGGMGIICGKPFYKEGEIAGVAGVGSFLDDINALVMETKIGKTGYVFLMDDKGQVNISPKTTGEIAVDPDNLIDLRTSSNKALADAAIEMTMGNSGIKVLAIDGKEVFLAYEPMKNLGWSFAVLIEVDEVLTPANESQASIIAMTEESSKGIDEMIRSVLLTLILVALLVSLITILACMRWAEKLVNPIKTLVGEVHKIGEGELESDITIKTGDEVEILADSFNKMTVKLRGYIENLTEITAEKERIGAELNVATKIQASMLPCIFPAFPDIKEIDIYASMTPAKEVGGDFYDFFLIDKTHIAVIMADVSGKGVPAALFMVIAKTLIKNHAQQGKSPSEVFTAVNAQLCENNDAGMFVTAFMGILDFSSGHFVYANAGHNAPLICKRDGTFEWLKSKPEFVLAGMEDIKYSQSELMLDIGDVFFTYTDGVTESLNPEQQLYSDARLRDTLNRCALNSVNPKALLTYVFEDVQRYADGEEQADDITMLGLLYTGGERHA